MVNQRHKKRVLGLMILLSLLFIILQYISYSNEKIEKKDVFIHGRQNDFSKIEEFEKIKLKRNKNEVPIAIVDQHQEGLYSLFSWMLLGRNPVQRHCPHQQKQPRWSVKLMINKQLFILFVLPHRVLCGISYISLISSPLFKVLTPLHLECKSSTIMSAESSWEWLH